MNQSKVIKSYKRIFLCGFMGAGKSVLGSALAKELKCPFHDLDNFIESRSNKKISEIFVTEGEHAFRELELKYLLQLSKKFTGVIALGGGALQNQNIVDHVKLSGLLVFIDTPLEVILERVYSNPKRPIVIDKKGKIKPKELLFDELKVIYSNREGLYNQAHITISTSDYNSVSEITSALKEKLNRYV